ASEGHRGQPARCPAPPLASDTPPPPPAGGGAPKEVGGRGPYSSSPAFAGEGDQRSWWRGSSAQPAATASTAAGQPPVPAPPPPRTAPPRTPMPRPTSPRTPDACAAYPASSHI